MNKKQLLELVEKHAKKNKFKLNPDKSHLNLILNGLLANEKKHGEIYCPCRVISGNKTEDKKKICPCFWHKKEIKKFNHCLCRLFHSSST